MATCLERPCIERENCGSREGWDMALNYRVCSSTSAKTQPCEGPGRESLRAKDKCGGYSYLGNYRQATL